MHPLIEPRSRPIVAASAAWAGIALLVLGALTAWLVHDGAPWPVDRWVDDVVTSAEHERVRLVGRVLALPGTETGSLVAGLLVGGFYWITRRAWMPAALILVAYVGAFSTAFALKHVVARVPPRLWLAQPDGLAFPSGHVARAGAVLGTIVVILSILEGRRVALIASIASVAALTGTVVAQVYLRLHWSTDLVGGLAVAVFWVAILVPIAVGRPLAPQHVRAGSDAMGSHDKGRLERT
ncbi:MAG: phosphatase PAP2 family protein [Actinomycetota bacterium]